MMKTYHNYFKSYIQSYILPLSLCVALSACSSNSGGSSGTAIVSSPYPDRVVAIDTAGYDSFPVATEENAQENAQESQSPDNQKTVTLPAISMTIRAFGNRKRILDDSKVYDVVGVLQSFNSQNKVDEVILHFNRDYGDDDYLARDFRARNFLDAESPNDSGIGRIRYSTIDGQHNPRSGNYAAIQISNQYPFGFPAKYMAYLSWQTEVRNIPIPSEEGEPYLSVIEQSMMITGFETETIPIDGTAIFNGAGHGFYYYGRTNKKQILFDVTANVNFSARNVKLNTHNVQKQGIPIPELSFDSTLRYDAGRNHLTGDVAADGMQGKIEARFYGTGDNAAQELGGIFAMENDDKLYHGAFGAKRY